jgi:hypothetical protein
MVKKWHSFNDHTLAKLEKMGAPWWLVTVVAFLIGFEISYYLSGNR